MSSDLSVDVVRDLESSWSTFEPIWRRLYERDTGASPYLSPSWVSTWVQLFANELDPHLVIVKAAEDEPCGIALVTIRHRRRLGFSQMEALINTDGEPNAESVVIQHNRILAAGRPRAAVATAVLHAAMSRGADDIRLSGIPADDVPMYAAALPGWIRDEEWMSSPAIDLNALRSRGMTILASLSRNTREKVRRSLQAYAKRGTLEFCVAATEAEASDMFNDLLVLHRNRWQSVGKLGGFGTRRREQFHRMVVAQAVSNGDALLTRVRVGGRCIGVLYFLRRNGALHLYQSGLHFETSNHLRPGYVSHALTAQFALDQGFDSYDFGISAPGEGRYKVSLSNTSHALGWMTFSRPTTFARARALLRHSKSALRGVRDDKATDTDHAKE